MAAKRKTDLASLVQGAGSEIAPIQRGRGLAGMLSEDPAAVPETQETALSIQDDMSAKQRDGISASPHDDKTTLQHDDTAATPAAEPLRRVKSYRIRDDLAYQIDVLAAQQRRKVYELVEEALSAYLRQGTERTEQPS
jgi:hypothetical protein